MKAILMLEDGKSFTGEALGVQGERIGRVFFDTAVVGYQEMLTDPANAGKILVLTYPLIGNYGCAPKFNESKKAWLSGLVIKENSRIYSNWQAKQSFDGFIKEHNLLVIRGVDTRTLAVHIRNNGEMIGIISTVSLNAKELLAKIEKFRKKQEKSLLPEISVKKPVILGKAGAKRIAILDLGINQSVINQLERLGLSIEVFPYKASFDQILKIKPKGLIVSGGPEDDPGLEEVVGCLRNLIKRLPILGIATGYQVLARALGAKVVKMKVGHHGVNYPICSPGSLKGEITTQNHSYAVDPGSLKKIKHIDISAVNLNDNSIEEIESKKLKLIGAQYSPVSPGFNEANAVFKKFIKMLSKE